MINALNLIWIIPLSMVVGAAIMAVSARVLKDEYRKMFEDEECVKYDN